MRFFVRRDFICVYILLKYLLSAGSVLFIHKMRSEPEQSGWYFSFAPYKLLESVEMKKLSSSGDAKILFDVFYVLITCWSFFFGCFG